MKKKRHKSLKRRTLSTSTLPSSPRTSGPGALMALNSKQVKQRDKEETEFLHRMQKYEQHFNPEDKKAYQKRLYFFYLVSDFNWNSAINDLREEDREDLGIIISARTASIRPWKRGRGRGGQRSRGGGNQARGASSSRGRGAGNA